MPASIEVQFARLIQPFPLRRLSNILYPVQADAAALGLRLDRLLIDPPATPEDWRFELQTIATHLWSIADNARSAGPPLEGLMDRADADFEVALRAVRAMLSGLRVSDEDRPPAAIEPESVPEPESAPQSLRTPANGPDPDDVPF